MSRKSWRGIDHSLLWHHGKLEQQIFKWRRKGVVVLRFHRIAAPPMSLWGGGVRPIACEPRDLLIK